MSASACALVSQFPALVPCCLTPGTWSMRGGHRGIEQPVGGRLARQFLDGRQALVDGRGRVAAAFERGAVRLDGGAGEGGTSLLRAPAGKNRPAPCRTWSRVLGLETASRTSRRT